MKSMTNRIITAARKMAASVRGTMGRPLRRGLNHNLHVMTHHGKLMVGRKGRRG